MGGLDKGEIVRAFRERAVSEVEMIKILADLHCATPEQIWSVLQEAKAVDNMPYLEVPALSRPSTSKKASTAWDDAAKDKLVALAERGLTTEEIARELGRTVVAVQVKAVRLGVSLRQGKRAVSRPAFTVPASEPQQADPPVQEVGLAEGPPGPPPKCPTEPDMFVVLPQLLSAASGLFAGSTPWRCCACNSGYPFVEVEIRCAGRQYCLRLEEVNGGEQ